MKTIILRGLVDFVFAFLAKQFVEYFLSSSRNKQILYTENEFHGVRENSYRYLRFIITFFFLSYCSRINFLNERTHWDAAYEELHADYKD